MSQHDYNIANGGGAAVRADLNLALAAILSQNSGATAPTTTSPFMLWYDTVAGALKMRNAANTAWVAAIDGITGGNPQGMKNRIINGAMVIDQRNAGASVTPTAGAFLTDRWAFYVSQASKFTAQQNAGAVTLPAGFSNYAGITSSSAYSVTATDQFTLYQKVEGFNFADMAWGTASAATITLSFKVYSSLTGTFGGSLQNSASNRCYPFSYSVPVANTWTTVSVTIAGDTTGTWIGGTNGVGVHVIFSLGSGSTYSATAGAWTGSNYITSATGATSVVGTSGATFYITGVQLEKGSTATAFDYRPYGTELALCQRYFEVLPTGGAGLYGSNANLSYVSWQYKVTKRASPTISLAASSSITAFDYANEWGCNGYSNPYSLIRGGTTASAEL